MAEEKKKELPWILLLYVGEEEGSKGQRFGSYVSVTELQFRAGELPEHFDMGSRSPSQCYDKKSKSMRKTAMTWAAVGQVLKVRGG